VQTLGISESTPRSESRARTLLWPTISNEVELDYVTRQGFWICLAVALLSSVVRIVTGAYRSGLAEAIFFFLAGMGVRERSRIAGLSAFVAYLLMGLIALRFRHGIGALDIVFLALLFANVRGNWLAARWPEDAAVLRLC
jgi:hypothetical protein